MSPTVFREAGFRFFFFSREEPRMHIHVQSNNGEAKFWLEPDIQIAQNHGLSMKELNEATASLRSIKMRSAKRGSSTFSAEVTNISCNGIWMLIDAREMFLAFEHFPWFQESSIKKILHVEMPSENHLYWPLIWT